MNKSTISFTVKNPRFKAYVTVNQVIEVISSTKNLNEQIKEISLDVIDKHSGDSFKNIEELLGIGFPPEIVDALQVCNELIQLFV